MRIGEFVNADVIATGLAGFRPESVSLASGRIMLNRLHELAEARESFAFESTLASRTFAPWLSTLVSSGYVVHVVYVWLESADLAVQRVAERYRRGGHSVPEIDVGRRYQRSCANFLHLYMPIATKWTMFNNSGDRALLVAGRTGNGAPIIRRKADYTAFLQVANRHEQR